MRFYVLLLKARSTRGKPRKKAPNLPIILCHVAVDHSVVGWVDLTRKYRC